MTDALEGIKVLDLCRGYPPAFSAMYLADFGADVIKVDPPGYAFPIPAETTGERWSACFSMDRSKKGIGLNLRTEQGREIFYKLAKDADVILENSRPGTMDRLGIGYETIKAINPRIVYCSVSGYGVSGPYKNLPAHDNNYLGIAGVLSLFGKPGGPPLPPSNFIGDMGGAACHALIGILLALVAREKTDKGQFVDVSYLDSVMSLTTFEVSLYQLSGIMPKRGRTFRTGAEPCVNQYKCKDGEYFSIAALEPQFWRNLCRELGREDLIPHQWTQDSKKKKEIFDWLRKTFLTKTRDEWWEWFKTRDIAAGPVYDLEEGLRDPQVLHRELVLELEHPKVGKVKQVGIPIKLSETPGRFRFFTPLPYEHTAEVLKGLGYSGKQIEELAKAGAVVLRDK